MNRRDLLLLTAASALPASLFSSVAEASPPPSSLRYLIFIATGVWQISDLFYVTLPPEAGTAGNYNTAVVSAAFGANFVYTGNWGDSPWRQLSGAPTFRWYEYLDRRFGNVPVKIWRGDRLDARFADGSRVKMRFNGPDALYPFSPLKGTERLPDGSLLNPPPAPPPGGRLGDRDDGCRRTRSCRGDTGGSSVVQIRPAASTFLWSWSTQQTPW